MGSVNFSKDAFANLIVKILLPILVIVLIVSLIQFIYARNAEKKGISNYNSKVNFYSTLISIAITLVLLAITICFSVNFINIMSKENLIETNKLVYYILICSPLIPSLFLIYLICEFVKSISNIKSKEIESNENQNQEVLSGINSDSIDNKKDIEEDSEENIELL